MEVEEGVCIIIRGIRGVWGIEVEKGYVYYY